MDWKCKIPDKADTCNAQFIFSTEGVILLAYSNCTLLKGYKTQFNEKYFFFHDIVNFLSFFQASMTEKAKLKVLNSSKCVGGLEKEFEIIYYMLISWEFPEYIIWLQV